MRYSRAPGSLANGIGHEALGRQLRPAEVAARQPGAADVDLARHADRHRLQGRVEQAHGRGRGIGRADHAAPPAEIRRAQRPVA